MEAGTERPLLYVLESLSVPISLHDQAGRVLYQNAAHVHLFGDCSSQPCHQMLRHSDERCCPCALDSGGECAGEESLADGRRAVFRTAPLPDGEGHLFEVTQVLEAKPEYEEVESFVHTAAHDLKTPLVSIKGYAELLQRELGGPAGSERGKIFSERILQQAQRMEGLLDELLAFARADTSGGEARDLDLATAARSAWSSLLDLAEPIGAHLEIHPELPQVRLSAIRMQQVLTNLFSNAIRYRRPNHPLRVTLRPHRVDRGRSAGTVCVAVVDNGAGVREGDEERIFRLFHRGRRAGEESTEGSGIGLAIVKRIVDGAGGAIWVERCEEGSRFVLCLPAAREQV